MKRKLFSAVVTAGLFTSFTPAWAATCTTAPVSTYTAAGFSCNIGGLTFSNIVVTPTLNGGTVTLTDFTPVNPTGGEFGLRLDYTASASGINVASVQWTYSVAGVPNIGDAYFAFDGSATGAAASVAFITLSNISGTRELSPIAPSFETAFTLTSSINGNATQQNAGQMAGTATGRSLTQAFSGATPPAIPLPATLPLFATGLIGLGLLGWRRKRKAAA
jgi:hypothetical protein